MIEFAAGLSLLVLTKPYVQLFRESGVNLAGVSCLNLVPNRCTVLFETLLLLKANMYTASSKYCINLIGVRKLASLVVVWLPNG